mmetsp:Transcript_30024/g.45535  ORF Transcript_30024/g.45535 Transcript_30024/m.45535 type:complete len:326 (-) Transcript_30024:265-1242(-)
MEKGSPSPDDIDSKRSKGILERINQSVTKLELSDKLDASKQRFARTVQNLELNEKYNDSTIMARKSMQRLNQSVTKLELSDKIDASKQRFAKTVQHLELNEKYERIGGAVGDAALSIADRLQLSKMMKRNPPQNDEEKARQLMLEAEAACTQAMKDHLLEFVQKHPKASYEEWIGELHPENLHDGRLLDLPSKELDHRFYVKESDHRKMWNLHLDAKRQYVPSRSSMWDKTKDVAVPDLLDDANRAEISSQNQASVKEGDCSTDQIMDKVPSAILEETDQNLLTLGSTEAESFNEHQAQKLDAVAEVSTDQNISDQNKEPWGDLF